MLPLFAGLAPQSAQTTIVKVQLLSETIAPDEFIRDAAWCAEEKLDGFRCILIFDANGVRAMSASFER